jgi:hypothetical protein
VTRLANPRTVRRTLIPAAGAVFFAGILVSALVYFHDQPAVDLRRAIISNLARPTDNPHGYLAAGTGMALCGLLLMPAALWFFRVLRALRASVAALGLLMFGASLTGAVFIGVMSPFQDAYSDIHIYVAYATFLLMSAGTLVWMAMVALASRSRKLRAAFAVQAAVALFVLYLTVSMIFPFGPDFFNDRNFWRSGALCEWILCAGNVIYLFILAAAVERVELNAAGRAARVQSR